VGTVAGAEPAAEIASLADGHAAQVCADAWFSHSQSTASPLAARISNNIPSMTSHSGFLTRSSSLWGSLNEATLTLLASSISAAVRWRMKTGLPLHLIMTCRTSASAIPAAHCRPPNGNRQYPYVLALGNGIEVDLDLGHGQDISGSGHVDEELCCTHASSALFARSHRHHRHRPFAPHLQNVP
jgi:hypothetical protein